MLASKDFGRVASTSKANSRVLLRCGECAGRTAFATLPDRRLVRTPEIRAFFGSLPDSVKSFPSTRKCALALGAVVLAEGADLGVDLGVEPVGPLHGRLEVVQDQPPGDPAEVPEGALQAAEEV